MTITDEWYKELGGTGVEDIDTLEFEYWAAVSGLTPKEEYSLTDHKYAALSG